MYSQIKIGDFLQNFDKRTGKGVCKACGKIVTWARVRLASHKRANCNGVNVAEKEQFRIITPTTSSANNTNSISSNDISMEIIDDAFILTPAKKEEIDSALANLCVRTGISFRIIDSEAFHNFVMLLNLAYAKVMPNSRTLSGAPLDKEYNKSFDKVQDILGKCTELTLISDGWTNCRGDHIINFFVKAPSKSSCFFKSISTVGIIQNAEAVANAICEVLEELGPTRFSCLVTNSASVMVAAHKIIENKYSNILACAPIA